MIPRSLLLVTMLASLAALSACKEKKESAPADTPAQALTVGGAIISPLCFVNGGDHSNPVYRTRDCDTGQYTRDPSAPSPMSQEFVSTAYLYTDPDTPDQKYPGFVGYKFLGDYRGLKAVEIIENGGGSGVFTSVQLLRPEADGSLRIIQTLAGGDRCNGGIAEAFMEGKTLVYDVNLTPFDFLTEAKYNPKNLQAYDDIDACAVCCYARLQYVDGRPKTVTLDPAAIERIAKVPEEEQTMQSCFDEVFTRQVKAGETTLTLQQLRDFVTGFYQTCAKQ